MPAQPGAAMAKQAAPAAAAGAAKTGMSRWMGPLVGLAAGLGIAALLSHFGLSEAFAGFLMLALIVVAVVVALRFLLARRAAPTRQPLQYAGPAGLGNAPGGYETQAPPTWGGAAPKADAPVMPGADPAATVAARPPGRCLPTSTPQASSTRPSCSSASCRPRTTRATAPRWPTS